jgi:zinc/manganese transport system permease protein
LFALVATASVQLVGVYVVFASLILPALAVNTIKTYRVTIATALGILSIMIGISTSTLSDLPAGPILVVAFALTAILWRFSISAYRRAQSGGTR